MNTGDWIGTALTVFGFGFSLWALMLRKAIATLEKINVNLAAIDKRLSVLEQWREFQDEERRISRSFVAKNGL